MSSTAIRLAAGDATQVKYVGGMVSMVKAEDGENGQRIFTFRATTDAIDRDGEIVTTDGWDFAAYERNPVILDCHDYRSGTRALVGRAIPPLRRVDNGWEVDVVFAPTEDGERVQTLVEYGFLKAVSVGFAPKKIERSKDQPAKHVEKELLEISVVPIPSNREALRVAGLSPMQEAGWWDGNSRSLATILNPQSTWTTASIPEFVRARGVETVGRDGKAIDFDQAMAQTDLTERKWEMYHALCNALHSIVEDPDLDDEGKLAAADKALDQYHAAMLAVIKAALALPGGGETVMDTAEVPETKAGRELSSKNQALIKTACDELRKAADMLKAVDGRLAGMVDAPAEDDAGKDGAPNQEPPAEQPVDVGEPQEKTAEQDGAETPTDEAQEEISEPASKDVDALADVVSAFAALVKGGTNG